MFIIMHVLKRTAHSHRRSPSRLRTAPPRSSGAGAGPAAALAARMAQERQLSVFLLYARPVDRLRLGHDRAALSLDHLFDKYVKQSLLRSAVPAEANLADTSTSQAWIDEFGHNSSHVIALVLARPLWRPSLLTYLERHQRHVYDFWQITKYDTCDLVFVDIVDTIILERPQQVFSSAAGFSPHGVFFRVTQFSAERCMQERILGQDGRLVREQVAQWRHVHNGGAPLASLAPGADHENVCLSWALPLPHAMLCAARTWPTYAFPLATGRQGAGLGLSLVQHWIQGLRAAAPAAGNRGAQLLAPQHAPAMSPDLLQDLADSMRSAVAGLAPGHDLVKFHVSWLQQMRDNMLLEQVRRSRSVFRMADLLQTMLLSGMLRQNDRMKFAIETSLRVAVHEDTLRNYYLTMLRETQTVPGRSTLFRHRLTIHTAFCRFQALELSRMLDTAGGVVRWGTVDTSPQGGHDWVMFGFSTMLSSVAFDSYTSANRLMMLGPRLADLSDAEAQEHATLVELLTSRLQIVQGVPTAVGSGRASMSAKLHCLAHACRLTACSWREVAALLSSTWSFTCDLGTEAAIGTMEADLQSLFGEWVRVADGGGDGAAAPPPAGPDTYKASLRGSIVIAGVLHILHNCTKDLGSCLTWWTTFTELLTHLTRLLSRPWSKQRLLATCFAEYPQRAYIGDIQAFNAQVYEARWGQTLHAISELVPLKAVLRSAWNLRRFTFGNVDGVDRDRGDDQSVRLSLADQAIRSDQFWAYLDMIDLVGHVINEAALWAESCPCHPRSPDFRTRFRRVHAFRDSTGQCACPMRTRRAPEMADGAMVAMVRQLCTMARPQLLLYPSVAALGEEGKRLVLAEFGRARRHLIMVFVLKFSHWRQLPWLLFGIAHHDAAVAKRCAARACLLFASSPQEVQRHPVVSLLCRPGSVGHEQLRRFSRGDAGLRELPVVASAVGKLKFAPIAERWVEGLHATSKRFLKNAPHHSALHLAWSIVQAPLQHLIQQRPDVVSQLADLCWQVRNTRRALNEVGLWWHPEVQGLVARCVGQMRDLGRSHRHWIIELIYHVDRNTLFQDRTYSSHMCCVFCCVVTAY